MKKILIFLERGVEDSEFIYPYYRFQEEDYEMDIVAPKAKQQYNGKQGVSFISDVSPREVNVNDYEALIVPGGQAPDRMRINSDLVKIVKDANSKGKIIAAVCHGPQLLIEAGHSSREKSYKLAICSNRFKKCRSNGCGSISRC